jgi:hypothetical protein
MNHPQYKTLNACYMYYHAASRTPLSDLVNDCLVQAHNVNEKFSFYFIENLDFVFSRLNLMYSMHLI